MFLPIGRCDNIGGILAYGAILFDTYGAIPCHLVAILMIGNRESNKSLVWSRSVQGSAI